MFAAIPPKKAEIPRWIAGPERCISCNKPAKLVRHAIVAISDKENVVQAHYKCECGYESGINFHGGHVKAYQSYLDEKAKEEANGTTSTVSPGPDGKDVPVEGVD